MLRLNRKNYLDLGLQGLGNVSGGVMSNNSTNRSLVLMDTDRRRTLFDG